MNSRDLIRYLTQKIVSEVLGGVVRVESHLGEGSIFSLNIPRELTGIVHNELEVKNSA